VRDDGVAVVRPQRREQQHVLQREALMRVVQHVLEPGNALLSGLEKSQILTAVEVEVAVDETIEIVAIPKAHFSRRFSQPSMVFGADAIEILGPGSFFALSNPGGILAAKPRFDAVRIDFFARVVELADALAPARICLRPPGLLDVGQQKSLQHVRRAE